MYTLRGSRVNESSTDVFNMIEGTDIFNSKYIFELSKIAGTNYKITSDEGRLDLILSDTFNDKSYYGDNYILNRITNNNSIKIGKSIELLDSNKVFFIKSSL